MIRTAIPSSLARGLKAGALTAARPFSSSVSTNKSKRLPSFAEIKAVQLEKYIQDIRKWPTSSF